MSLNAPNVALNSTKDPLLIPPLSQIYATLRICLRYGSSSANIFNRLLKVLEVTCFIPILNALSEVELGQLLPILAQRLTRLRLEMTDVPALYTLCRQKGVSQMQQVVSCEVVQSEVKSIPSNPRSGIRSHCHLHLLGKLFPRLELLNVHACVAPPFPKNLLNLRGLLLRQGVSQMLLDQICANCPQLQRLLLRNESLCLLDMGNLPKCYKLKDLHMPLMIRSPLSLCGLANLEHLSLQRLQLWPGMDWVPIIQDIINAKRYELRSLSFDGSWLVGSLDLSVLHLKYCWALEELLLSNCKMADHIQEPELPISCQRLGFRNCKLSRPLRYLKRNAQVTLLELHGCHMLAGSEQLLQNLLNQRQSLPAIKPLQVRFSLSTPLRMELTSWSSKKRKHCEKWLIVTEQHSDAHTWEQPIGTISMKFGKSVSYMPDLDLNMPNGTKPNSKHDHSKCLLNKCLAQELTSTEFL